MRTILIIATFFLFEVGIQAQIQLDVVGDIIRLTSTSDVNRYIQLRTDGSDVDIDVSDFLWINSLGVRITNMDTTINSLGNVVIQGNGILAVRRYKIGDLVHGGIVFWVDETGEHGLVCSLNDLESVPGESLHQWSAGFEVTGATGGTVDSGSGEGKGAGAMNTILIISEDRADTDSAARLCADLVEGGYGDWYLSSKGELHLMYTNLHLAGLGGFATAFYWSSTEIDENDAWRQDFDGGLQLNPPKGSFGRVRAIRAF